MAQPSSLHKDLTMPNRSAVNCGDFWKLIFVGNMIVNFTQWRFKIPMLQDFPLATIPANSLDEMLPAVGWQVRVRS